MLSFCFKGAIGSVVFFTLILLLERITFLYGTEEYDEIKEKSFPFIVIEKEDRKYILNDKDFNNLSPSEKTVSQTRKIDGKEVYVDYVQVKKMEDVKRSSLAFMKISDNKKVEYVDFIMKK